MMWWNHSWGSGWGWILVMAVVMVVCVAMMARMMRHGGSGPTGSADNRDGDAPERILARRLASGEIDVAEFERLRGALRRPSNSTADAAEPSSAKRRPPPA
jgi:putative membrane protein